MVVGVVGRPRVGKTMVAQLLTNVAAATQGMGTVYISDSDTSIYLDNANYHLSNFPENFEDEVRELVDSNAPAEHYRRLFVKPFGPKIYVGVIGGFISSMSLTHDVIINSLKAMPSDRLVVMDINAKEGMGNYLELVTACNVIVAVGMCDNYIFDMMAEYNKNIDSNRALAYKHIWLINKYDEKMKSVKAYDKVLTCGQKPIHTLEYCPALKRVLMNAEYNKLTDRLYKCHPELELATKSAIEVLQHLYDSKDKKIIKPYGSWL